MKKDKEKYQPASQSATTDEPKNSLAAIMLQLLNKEKEKIKEAEEKEAAAEAAKVHCRVCFKEIAPKYLCSGHGGGRGGGSSTTSDKTSGEKANSGEDKSLTKPDEVVESMDGRLGEFNSVELDLESNFDPKIIAELIANGLLLVDSDRESMTLTIKLLCEPNALTKEQREELKKFMEGIIKEFNEFKEENNLSDDCVHIIQDEEVCIIMPTLALYDAFIQRLANNLVPVPSPKAQEKDDLKDSLNLATNPLSIEPKPLNKDKLSKREEIEPNKNVEPKKEKEEVQKIFNPSPFKMKPG